MLATLMTRRSIIRRSICYLASQPLQAAFGHEISPNYESVPKAAWAWRLQLPDLPRLAEIARQQGLTRILLSLSAPILNSLSRGKVEIIDALNALADQGIAVVALLGQREWVLQPGAIPAEVLSTLHIHERTGLFDALHLDVEPHTLPEWNGPSRDVVAERYLALVSAIGKAAAGFPLEVAIHPVYANVAIAGRGSLLSAVAECVSEVSIMAYRNQPHNAVQFASEAIRVLESSGVSWRFGVLTHESQVQKLTYAGTTPDYFQQSMVSLNRMLATMSSGGHYRGLIFEDYFGLLEILP